MTANRRRPFKDIVLDVGHVFQSPARLAIRIRPKIEMDELVCLFYLGSG
jgi:hypothetical protein